MRKTSLFIFITSLFLAAGFCFCDLENAFAEGGSGAAEEQLSLKVYYEADGKETLLHSYDAPALKAIAAAEGNQEYTFSSYNTYPQDQAGIPCSVRFSAIRKASAFLLEYVILYSIF